MVDGSCVLRYWEAVRGLENKARAVSLSDSPLYATTV